MATKDEGVMELPKCMREGCPNHIKPGRRSFCSRPCQWTHINAGHLERRAMFAQLAREGRAKQSPERRSELASRARRIGVYQHRMRILGERARKLPRRLTLEDIVAYGMDCYKLGKNAERMRHAQKEKAAA
jgi:hypothetical protein